MAISICPEYREQKYVCSGRARFLVDADFPRLTADTVMPQIIAAQYSISLAGIECWRVEVIHGGAGIQKRLS